MRTEGFAPSAKPPNPLEIDAAAEADRICDAIRCFLRRDLARRGLVVAVSGGVDSAVTLALAARALGNRKVLALLLPERDSDPQTVELGRRLSARFDVERAEEDITAALEALGHYRRYAAAARCVFPEYGEGWRSKLTTSDVLTGSGYTVFSLVAQSPDGREVKRRVPLRPYLDILASMNFKQRVRKLLEYYHAERRHFAVAGTPNRLEYELGFFVKQGDGAADLKPIAHLYKTQVYQLADYLGIPPEIIARKPTTDTFSLPQGQDEFFFSLPYPQMDLCLYAKNAGIPPEEAAAWAGLTPTDIRRVYADIDRKRSTTRYLHRTACLVSDIPYFSSKEDSCDHGCTDPSQAIHHRELPV